MLYIFIVILNGVDPGDNSMWQQFSRLSLVLTSIKAYINNDAEKLRAEENYNQHNTKVHRSFDVLREGPFVIQVLSSNNYDLKNSF